jgi:hypothetical protein
MKFYIAIAALALIVAVDAAVLAASPSWWFLPAALAGWYLADSASGIVHMYMDYIPSRPGIGLDRLFFYEGWRESEDYIAMRDSIFARLSPLERLIYDFKNHHPRPDALGRRSMLVQVGPTVLFATLPFAVLVNTLFAAFAPPAWLLAVATSLIVGATFAQYFHGTLHRDDNPWPIRLMRQLGLLMLPQDHVRHHQTLTRDFSTINGWSNPILNRVFVFLIGRGILSEEGLIPR